MNLTTSQKLEREGKIAKKKSGLKWAREIPRAVIDENHVGMQDDLPREVLDRIHEYPDSPPAVNSNHPHKIIDIIVNGDGSGEIKELVLNGNEGDPRIRAMAGVLIPSDKELFRIERYQFGKGILQEVDERTLKMHKQAPHWADMDTDIKSNKIKIIGV